MDETPLAAPSHGDSNAADDGEFVDAEFIDVDGTGETDAGWCPEQGFRDARRAVRVWLDDDEHLRRIQVSVRWRERLRGSSLQAAFSSVFSSLNAAHHAGEYPLPRLEPLELDLFEGKLGWHTLRAAYREWERVEARMAELGDVPPTRWVGDTVSGSSYDGAVEVSLGIFGEPLSVTFDDDWLDRNASRVNQISRGVMSAYHRALGKHHPPHVEYGEWELLLQEHDGITKALMNAFSNGLEV